MWRGIVETRLSTTVRRVKAVVIKSEGFLLILFCFLQSVDRVLARNWRTHSAPAISVSVIKHSGKGPEMLKSHCISASLKLIVLIIAR
jgi:hypothetical protein